MFCILQPKEEENGGRRRRTVQGALAGQLRGRVFLCPPKAMVYGLLKELSNEPLL
jgi:hypothetical protein